MCYLMFYILYVLCLLTEGPGAGRTLTTVDSVEYGSGASHGGEGGAEDSTFIAPSAYGNFITPDRFGSAGGDTSNQTGNVLVGYL